MTLGVIIAGGQSQRFNESPSLHQDKFLANFGSTTLLGHIIDRAKSQCDDLILNVNGDHNRVLKYGLDIISDDYISNDYIDVGPLGGILAALSVAQKKGHSHIITFSSDSPFFPDDYLDCLMSAVNKDDKTVAVASSKGRCHPVMGAFSVTCLDSLKHYIESGERRVMPWVRQQAHEEVIWQATEPDPFFNINRVQDLALAEKYL